MYNKYLSTIKALAHDFFPNKADAEDAIQEVCIKLLDMQPPQTEDTNEDAWAYVVISNALKDEYRKSKSRNKPVLMYADELVDEADPFEYVAKYEKLAYIKGNYSSLPKEIKEACELRYHEQLSYDEIAKRQGVPIGTVGSRLARGKEMLSYSVDNE